MNIKKIRIVVGNMAGMIGSSIIMFLAKMEWRTVFTKLLIPSINIPIAFLIQPLSLLFDYIKVGLSIYELVKAKKIMLNMGIALATELAQSTLKTITVLGLIGVMLLPALVTPILLVSVSAIGLIFASYHLINNFINWLEDKSSKNQLTLYQSMLAVTVSMAVVAGLSLLLLSGLGPLILLTAGIVTSLILLAGTAFISGIGWQINKTNTVSTSEKSKNPLMELYKEKNNTVVQENDSRYSSDKSVGLGLFKKANNKPAVLDDHTVEKSRFCFFG